MRNEEEKDPENFSALLQGVKKDICELEKDMINPKKFKCLIANDEAM
jgi:hypothetical protein